MEGFLEEVGSTRPLKVSPEETGRGRCGHRAWEQTGLPAEATAVSAGGPPNGWREGGLDVGGVPGPLCWGHWTEPPRGLHSLATGVDSREVPGRAVPSG